MEPTDQALGELLGCLRARDYRFVTVTPATHARVLARPATSPLTLRDVFGWSRPFGAGELDPEVLELLKRAGSLEVHGRGRLRSAVRVSSLGDDLFLHSAYPTESDDAVFFGPDTYRFARFIAEQMARLPVPARILDMGAGSGAGGLAAAHRAPGSALTLVDANPRALALARVNAAFAGVDAALTAADRVPADAGADLILANPPYMMDPHGRAYREGGELLGGQVALDWSRQALDALPPGGTLLLYTGASVREGTAPLLEALEQSCRETGAALEVDELDPDVFGEELELAAYGEVERIAAIGARVTKAA